MTWNTNKLEIVDFYMLKEIIPKFKGKLVGVMASKDYLICSKCHTFVLSLELAFKSNCLRYGNKHLDSEREFQAC